VHVEIFFFFFTLRKRTFLKLRNFYKAVFRCANLVPLFVDENIRGRRFWEDQCNCAILKSVTIINTC